MAYGIGTRVIIVQAAGLPIKTGGGTFVAQDPTPQHIGKHGTIDHLDPLHIRLDDGGGVFGSECWWVPEEH